MRPTEAQQNRLIIDHVGLIAPIAAKFRGRKDIPFEELESEGMLALTAAARRFEPSRAMFSAYASYYIEGSLKKFIEGWQVMDHLDETSDEDENRIHEWQVWGIFPSEGYKRLPASPEDIGDIYSQISQHKDLNAAMLSLSRKERKMIAARFFQKPMLGVEQIARNHKCSYFDAISTIYDATRKLVETVKRIEQNKFLPVTKVA